jgi:valyl-tRNA synthetase
VFDAAATVLGHIRRAKSAAKRGMRAPVKLLSVRGPAAVVRAVRAAEGDLRAAGALDDLAVGDAQELHVDVQLDDVIQSD